MPGRRCGGAEWAELQPGPPSAGAQAARPPVRQSRVCGLPSDLQAQVLKSTPLVTLCSKYTRVLTTFENLCQPWVSSDLTCRHRQARAFMRAAACARVRCSVRDGVRARRHTADASTASRQAHLTASLVYESEGGEESAYDDHMSLEHLCATCRAAHVHARRASDHRCEPAVASSGRRSGSDCLPRALRQSRKMAWQAPMMPFSSSSN